MRQVKQKKGSFFLEKAKLDSHFDRNKNKGMGEGKVSEFQRTFSEFIRALKTPILTFCV